MLAEQHPVHREPDYWQPGKPYIQKVEYPAYLDNGPANLDLASGKAQWGSQFIPNIKKFYLAKSADNNTWSPPVTNVELFPNLDPVACGDQQAGGAAGHRRGDRPHPDRRDR